jgi:hypothetical protein
MHSTLKLKFSENDSISFPELALFIQYFLSTYRGLHLLNLSSVEEDTLPSIAEEGVLSLLSVEQLNICLSDQKLESDPTIVKISQSSPIEITICGSITLLSIAAVLSGGNQKIKLGPLEFQYTLSSLGDSLTKLRKAFSRNPTFQPKFGLSRTTIKLNKDEYEELKKETNQNGGFQRFLTELQQRMHRTRHTIELSNMDIEKILRYKSNPNKGGFQLRFNKIFSRHIS